MRVGEEEGWAPCGYIEKLNGEDDEEIIPSNGKIDYAKLIDSLNSVHGVH